jgi:hypothetical protein
MAGPRVVTDGLAVVQPQYRLHANFRKGDQPFPNLKSFNRPGNLPVFDKPIGGGISMLRAFFKVALLAAFSMALPAPQPSTGYLEAAGVNLKHRKEAEFRTFVAEAGSKTGTGRRGFWQARPPFLLRAVLGLSGVARLASVCWADCADHASDSQHHHTNSRKPHREPEFSPTSRRGCGAKSCCMVHREEMEHQF